MRLQKEVITRLYKTEIDIYKTEKDYISKEDYEAVVRENEKLKSFIKQLKATIELSLEF